MTHSDQLAAAYEVVRLAELGKRGAEMYLEEAGRDLDAARNRLESLVKGLPNRETQ